MFEVAELGHKLSAGEFGSAAPDLHTRLLAAQRVLANSNRSVVILVSGVEGAGKGAVVNRLNEWLDVRGTRTTAFWDETDEQALRPRYWRFWRTLPPRGMIGILFGSWYTQPIIDRVCDRIDTAEFEARLQEIVELERMLTADGTVLIKLWFHLAKDKVRKNLDKDMKTRKVKLRVNPWTRKFSRQFDRFVCESELAIRTTDAGHAPWQVIEATDAHYRDLEAGKCVLEALQQALPADALREELAAARGVMVAPRRTRAPKVDEGPLTVLDAVDLSRALDGDTYHKKLQRWQRKLNTLAWKAREQRRSVVLVFEGWDAAGKGSAIRRLTHAVDARLYKVISTGKPTDEEAAHHYLWRFWRHLPVAGYFSIYDRSWYGRVLVERVEQFTPEDDWQRAYAEINLFEQQLAEQGIILLKFWLHISPEEQLRRFREREKIPWKQHKITEEDWRNRARWAAYKEAVNDMVQRTSTTVAPWHLVAAENKKFARVDIIKRLCKTLASTLKQ